MSPAEWQPLGLPETTRAMPGEAPVDHRLAEVLYPPSVEQMLVDSCRPEVRNLEVLTPGGYQAALEDARSLLQDALGRAVDGGEKEKLQSALAILHEEAGLHNLLSTYRHLLHRA